MQIKFSQFFDKPGVLKHIKDGTRSTLSRAGTFIRTRAKSSIRKRKRAARPGEPPSSHTGKLKDLIFFAYDAAAQSVVIGPLLFRRKDPTGPHLLEKGGQTTITDPRGRQRPATYRKFPFMKPAYEAERGKFPQLFADSIK